MKLYFMPGACSLAVHIALREADFPVTLVEVDYESRKTKSDRNYLDINPKGYVPALQLDDGELLTEVPVILQHLNELVPKADLLPVSGIARLRALEWLNFIATEIHKQLQPAISPHDTECILETRARPFVPTAGHS